MAALPLLTQPISKVSQSTSYPIYPTQGGAIILDVERPTLFIQIMVGVSGSVIVQNTDGDNRYYPLVLAGSIYPMVGIKIVSSAVIEGNPVTTTASNIWCYGGK